MFLMRISTVVRKSLFHNLEGGLESGYRSATTTKHGVVLPQPQKTTFGLIKVILTVVPGLLIGAGISKNIANFLEENDLFVPSDDDDDDD